MTMRDRLAVNPLQWSATSDGWIDPSLAPSRPERLAALAELGFRSVHVEIADALEPEAYRRDLESAGLSAGPGICGADWAPEAAQRQAIVEDGRRFAAAYAALGVEVVFLSAGMTQESPRVLRAAIGAEHDEERLTRTVEMFERVARAMTEEGVRPALHPHVGSWVETERDTRAVLDTVGADILGFGPDTGHLAWTGADVPALVGDYAERVAGIHVKDIDLTVAAQARSEELDYRSTIMRGLWREPGHGDLDPKALVASVPGSPWLVVEVDRHSTPTPMESLRRCAEWAHALDTEGAGTP